MLQLSAAAELAQRSRRSGCDAGACPDTIASHCAAAAHSLPPLPSARAANRSLLPSLHHGNFDARAVVTYLGRSDYVDCA